MSYWLEFQEIFVVLGAFIIWPALGIGAGLTLVVTLADILLSETE